MTRRTRTLASYVVPALLVPAVVLGGAPAADAAAKPPAVPSLKEVATIYPHLHGGSVQGSVEKKITMPTKGCGDGPVITGASGREATYIAKPGKKGTIDVTGAKPAVQVSATQLPSASVATRFVKATLTEDAQCEDGESTDDVRLTKIHYRLGDQHWGFRVRFTDSPDQMNILLIRDGRRVFTVASMSFHGKQAPSVAKTIRVARLALRTAR